MPELNVDDETHEAIVRFISAVKTKKVIGSYNVTVKTVELLKKMVSEVQFEDTGDLLKKVKSAGVLLCSGLPQEAVIGNMVRRVLKIIREESGSTGKGYSGGVGDSLQGLVSQHQHPMHHHHQEQQQDLPLLRTAVLEHITEFQMEIDTCGDNIKWQAPEHIHSNEMILTLGASRCVEMFLKRAAEERTFQVLVAEGAPTGDGHKMAMRLAKANIETTFIADSAIFAVMSRVNKVMLATQTVLASGGLRAAAGAHTVALAAKHYSVPVIVLCPLYKLCPEHLCSYEQDNFNTLVSPEGALPYRSGALASRCQAHTPLYDYVPPDLVTLFITNSGGNAPSYIYRLLSELYDAEDYDIRSS